MSACETLKTLIPANVYEEFSNLAIPYEIDTPLRVSHFLAQCSHESSGFNFLLPAVTPIIDKLVDLIPNSNERARAREKFEFELMKAVNDAAEQQNAVNQVEAAHNSVFVAGWRPFIG